MFEAAVEIAGCVGTILAHMRYGKGMKKLKSKDKNPSCILYHRADVASGDAVPVPMELGKTTLKCWTFGGLNY